MLRKALKIVEKWLKVLKVPKVLIVECAEGADWVPKVPNRCRGAEVPSRCRGARVLGASTFPLELP